jgi:cytochrome c556
MTRHSPLRWMFALVALLLLAACTGEPADTHPQQLVTKRREMFKQFNRTLEPIGLVASGRKEYRAAELLGYAQDLERLADKPWPFFTNDSNYPPTHALAQVWSSPETFRAAQADYAEAVHQLVLAAQSGQLEQVSAATDKVTRSCKSCHNKFRRD